ncbi:hypothetical protein D3C77_767790 [compost metagenome]
MQALARLHHACLYEFLIEGPHRREILLRGHHAGFAVFRCFDHHHETHVDLLELRRTAGYHFSAAKCAASDWL